jgi:hypothetical protein
MQDNPFTFLGSAISQLLSSKSAALQATGIDIFRGLAVILIVWFGVKSALSASQGVGGGFQFAKFADLILMISFGLGMLTYYSTPIPGVGYSFSDLITQEALNLSGQIESDQTQQIATTVVNAEQQLGTPPGSFNILEDDFPHYCVASGSNAGRLIRRDRLRLCSLSRLCSDWPDLHSVVYRAETPLAFLGMVQGFRRFQLLSGDCLGIHLHLL